MLGEEEKQAVVAWSTAAPNVVVRNDEDYRLRESELLQILALRKTIAKNYEKPIKLAHEAHKAVLAAKKEYDEPLALAEKAYRDRMGAYRAEAQVLAAKGRQEAVAALEAEVAKLISAGDDVEAQAILAMPLDLPSAGVVGDETDTRVTWSAEVMDLFELVQAVASRGAVLTCIEANQSKLNELARQLKEHFAVPGCRAVSKNGIVLKRGGGK